MAERVYFHVGLPKTGTTFLQTILWHNRRALRAQGFLYPGRERMDHYHSSQVVRGASLEKLGEHAGVWDRLTGALAAWPGRGIITHEFFSMASAGQAKRAVAALAPADVQVIVTARDYERQFPAVWQEALKMNSNLSFDEFMEQAFRRELQGAWGWRSQDLPAVVKRWAQAVGPDRLHLITLPQPGAPQSLLWDRFKQTVEIDDAGLNLEVSRSNESLGAPQAALLHHVKPYLTEPLIGGAPQHRWVRQYFGHEVLVPQRGDRFAVRPAHAARLRELSLAAVDDLKTLGCHVVGDLDELIPPESPTPRPHPDDVTDTELLEVAARAFDQMIHDVRDLTRTRDALREELNQRDRAARRPRLPRRVIRRVRSRAGRLRQTMRKRDEDD